jgi:hypothetical protein
MALIVVTAGEIEPLEFQIKVKGFRGSFQTSDAIWHDLRSNTIPRYDGNFEQYFLSILLRHFLDVIALGNESMSMKYETAAWKIAYLIAISPSDLPQACPQIV